MRRQNEPYKNRPFQKEGRFHPLRRPLQVAMVTVATPGAAASKATAPLATSNKAATPPVATSKAATKPTTAKDTPGAAAASSRLASLNADVAGGPHLERLAAVLFLDVDGVLHPPNPKHERLQFRKTCMELLREVVAETGATIVLSTTWRLHPDARRYLGSRLAEYDLGYVSRTPSIAQFQRPKEILTWVRKYKPVTWVAVDDWPLHEDGARRTRAALASGPAQRCPAHIA